MGLLNGNGETKSTLAGLGLCATSAFFLYRAIIPWEAWAVASGVGGYLMLPQRFRKLGDWAVEKYNAFRGRDS